MRGQTVDWYQNVFELIGMRSFSNIWFWMVLAVLWSSLSHFVIGVPFDMVTRARRHDGQPMRDLEDMVRINADRRLHVARISGLWLVAVGTATLTMLALLGFYYRLEFAQALFLLLAPTTAVGFMSLRASARVTQDQPEGEDLCRFLAGHRFRIQLLGMVSIFVTAMWGMWQNMSVSALM